MNKEHKEYLDDLRESGVTNMFGAGTFLEEEFEITRAEAKSILVEWMKSFTEK